MAQDWVSREHGPGHCKNGHERWYRGDCLECKAESSMRQHTRKNNEARPQRADADGLLDMVLALIAKREAS